MMLPNGVQRKLVGLIQIIVKEFKINQVVYFIVMVNLHQDTFHMKHVMKKTTFQKMSDSWVCNGRWNVLRMRQNFNPYISARYIFCKIKDIPAEHSTPKWIWIKSSLQSKWPYKPQSRPPKGSKSLEMKIPHGRIFSDEFLSAPHRDSNSRPLDLKSNTLPLS